MAVQRWGGGAQGTELDRGLHDEGPGGQGGAACTDCPADVQARSLAQAFLFLKAKCCVLFLKIAVRYFAIFVTKRLHLTATILHFIA